MPEFSSSTEKSSIGVMHLKRYWEKCMAIRTGVLESGSMQEEWNIDYTLLNVLGLGLEQTITYLYQQAPSFEQFEKWILSVNDGALSSEKSMSLMLLFHVKDRKRIITVLKRCLMLMILLSGMRMDM